jgi:hypothetical protein
MASLSHEVGARSRFFLSVIYTFVARSRRKIFVALPLHPEKFGGTAAGTK